MSQGSCNADREKACFVRYRNYRRKATMTKAYLKIDDVKRLERAAAYLRDRLLIRILFHMGCRISEALAIRVEDIDFEMATITIEHLKTSSRLLCPNCHARLGRTHKFCPDCGNSLEKTLTQQEERRRMRTLPVDDDTLGMLKDYISRGGPILRDGKRLIFGINRYRGCQIIKQCAEKAGLPRLINPETGKVHNVSPHRLRDAFAVHAVKHNDSGDGLRMLQEHLGHRSIATTMRYRKVAGEEHRDWYNKLWNKEDAD